MPAILECFLKEWRYAARRVRRSPAFLAAVMLLLAVGLCANTVVFSFVDAVLLRPLPVREPERLVQFFQILPSLPPQPNFDYAFFDLVSREVETLQPVFGSVEFATSLEQPGAAARVHVEAVTGNYFEALGVAPVLGATPRSRERKEAVVSHGAWVRYFGADPRIVGRSVRLDGDLYDIVGVMPTGFKGTRVDTTPDFFISYEDYRESSKPEERPEPFISVVGRLPQGVSLAQASEQIRAVWSVYSGTKPLSGPFDRNLTVELRPIARGLSNMRDGFGEALILLLAGSGLLLVMVSLNVGGLLLARVTAEEKDIAVRLAVGATGARVALSRLFEISLITLAGGTAGILLSSAAIPVFLRWLSSPSAGGLTGHDLRPLTLDVTIDFRVIAFAIAASLVSMALAALAPVYRLARSDLQSVLKTGMSDRRHQRLQASLVAVQIGVCTILLIIGGLMLRTLSSLRAVDPGFDKESLVMFSIDPGIAGYDGTSARSLIERLQTEVAALPGVQSVGLSATPVMAGMGTVTFAVFPGAPLDSTSWNTNVNHVSPAYFDTMGIDLLDGEIFRLSEARRGDDETIPVIVNESFVRLVAGGRNPIGLVFDRGTEYKRALYRIVGLVRDNNYRSLREKSPPIYFESLSSSNAALGSLAVYVRVTGSPEAIVAPVRALIGSIDPRLPLVRATTMLSEVNRSLWRERVLESLSLFFSVFALALTGIGLYGILSHYVASRRREIGLRLALGASRHRMLWTLWRRILPPVISGMAAGTAAHVAAGSWISSLLFDVAIPDPFSIGAAVGLLVALSVASAGLPAIRAVIADPATSLRYD